MLDYSWLEVFISAILAGWLMAQGGWLIMATPPASSQIICIFLVTFLIGLGGLHHSIVGSAELFNGVWHTENWKVIELIRFLSSSVLGNLVGGTLFVGVLNYGHIRQTQ